MAYNVVIFDLDGTLLDTLDDLGQAVNHALGKRGFPLHSRDEFKRMVGHGIRNLVKSALPAGFQEDDRLVDECLSDFKSYYTTHIDVHTRPFEGMPELLREMRGLGVAMAVASNKFQEGTQMLIREFFPDIPFICILGNREGFPLKPDPQIVGEVLRLTGASRERAVLVGDSGTDMRTAQNGGIAGIAVGWGYRPMGATADYGFAGSVTELRTLLFARPFYVSELLSTAPAVPSTPLQKAVYEAFARLGIPFTRVDTDPGITMEDCLHIAGKIGVHIVKTVFVCNRQQTEFYHYVMPDDKPFVTREFCAALGIPRVSFASAEKLRELTGVAVGATTILSAILPEAAGVHLVIDRAIADSPWIACTDGTPTCFIKLPTRALLDTYLPACNHTYTII